MSVEAMGNAALVIAHPGHELRVHGWMARARPFVFVLTDGSGRTGRSRIESTTRVLAALDVPQGPLYGRFSDAEIYRAMLECDAARFVALAREIATAFATLSIDEVAGDALEGYNPTHDLCRYLIDAAVAMSRAKRREIASYDFPLMGRPDAAAPPDALRIRLGAEEVRSKETAARHYGELAAEVDEAVRSVGRETFHAECLRPVRDMRITPPCDPPEYERVGAERVAAGRYHRVLRYRDHLRPIAEALAAAAGSGLHCES